MKLPKSLITAIALGVTVGATATSCRQLEIEPEVYILHEHDEERPADCTIETEPAGDDPYPFPDGCPMCGMG